MARRIKGVAFIAALTAVFAVCAPAAAQQRSATRRYAPATGGYRPLSRQQTVGQPLVQWGSSFQSFGSPLGLPSPLQSPAQFFQVPGRSYQPLMGTYRPLTSGYRPTRGGYAPLSR